MSEKPTIHWRTEWTNGTPTHIISFSDVSESQRQVIEHSKRRIDLWLDLMRGLGEK